MNVMLIMSITDDDFIAMMNMVPVVRNLLNAYLLGIYIYASLALLNLSEYNDPVLLTIFVC